MTKSLMQTIAVAVWLLSAACTTGLGQDADASLTAYFKQYLEESFRLRPIEATRLGDHRFDRLMDDLLPKARAAWAEHDRKPLADLPKRVWYEKLSRDGTVDFEIFQHEPSTHSSVSKQSPQIDTWKPSTATISIIPPPVEMAIRECRSREFCSASRYVLGWGSPASTIAMQMLFPNVFLGDGSIVVSAGAAMIQLWFAITSIVVPSCRVLRPARRIHRSSVANSLVETAVEVESSNRGFCRSRGRLHFDRETAAGFLIKVRASLRTQQPRLSEVRGERPTDSGFVGPSKAL